MNIFLILSSLGAAFYLVVLAALYRDGRKRRPRNAGPIRGVTRGSVVRVDTPGATGAASFASRHSDLPEGVRWMPVTTHHWTPAARTASGGPAKRVYVAAPISGKDDLQCG